MVNERLAISALIQVSGVNSPTRLQHMGPCFPQSPYTANG
jgi:hypothetical protein